MCLIVIIIVLLDTLVGCAGVNQPEWQEWDEVREETLPGMAEEIARLESLDDVKALMQGFHGSCWEYAVLGQWALEAIGIESRILILYRGKVKHAVVLSNDNTIFITGPFVEAFHTERWREAVLTYYFFNPPFERLEELKL